MRIVLAAFSAAALMGCMSTQAGFTPLVAVEARHKDHPVEIFQNGTLPSRAFIEVAILDVHLEATHFIRHSFQDALPKLQVQARAAGGDAIIAIKESTDSYLETFMYHVTAKAIRYTQ